MNDLFVALGIEAGKPLFTALILPPVPMLLLVLIGGLVLRARRGLGWALLIGGVAGIWLSSCAGMAVALERMALSTPPALSASQRAELRERVSARQPVAIVALGGGLESLAPEYDGANLAPVSLARLRYAMWLARETGAPAGFSGGAGWAQLQGGPSEAQIAARIAQRDLGASLRWIEGESRDTRENAALTVSILQRDGIEEIVLVSHGWHLPRAVRAFRDAAAGTMRITAAPMGLAPPIDRPLLRWLPTSEGIVHMRAVVREIVGLLAGS